MVPEGTSSIERNQVSKYVKPKKLVPEGPKRKKAAGKKGGNAQKNKGNSTDYLGSKK